MTLLRALYRILTHMRLILVCLLILTASISLSAKHIIGGEMMYECLGETFQGSNVNRYLITMNIYRDCDPAAGGAFFDIPAYFSVFRNNEQTPYEVFTIFDYNEIPVEVDTPACILNVPFVCVEGAQYQFMVELPVTAGTWHVVYQRCCRNNSIVNITNPEDVGATYTIAINSDGQSRCNNTPFYKNFPPVIICKDVPLVFDHSATDADADLLVYSFCAPQTGGGPIITNPDYTSCIGAAPQPPCAPPFPNVPFIAPQYSPGNPIGGNPQITINPVTGQISGVPNMIGRYVVGVCVQEYRNGILLSTVKRDFQFNVTDCDPQVAVKIDGGDTLVLVAADAYYLNSCGNKSIFIENQSIDRNVIGDDFAWRFDLQGQPYFNNTDWSPTIDFPASGRYFGQLLLKPGSECADTANITIDIFPEVNADFEYSYDTCVAGPVLFNDLSSGEAGLRSWSWKFGEINGTSNIQDPDYLYNTPGIKPVELTVRDSNGCEDSRIKPITYLPAPPIIIIRPNSYTGCAPAAITFTNLSTPIDETYDIVWTFGDGSGIEGVISPEHTYLQSGIYDVSVAITSPIGCSIADTFPDLISIVPAPKADFSFSPDVVTILDPTVQFTDKSTDAYRHFWQFDRFGTTNQVNPTFTFPDTGLMRILLVVTHIEGCKDTLAKFIDVIPEVRWFMPNAFTPNGDTDNEGFYGKGYLEGSTDFVMTIWNRWGELVFETKSPTEAWNGRAQNTGGLSPSGVYVYRVTFTGPRGQKFEYKGFATLLR
jgi:gliding motility-associated-like protein